MQNSTFTPSLNEINSNDHQIPVHALDACVLAREDGILLDYDLQRGRPYLTSSEDWSSHILYYCIARQLYCSAIPAAERYLWRFYLVKSYCGHTEH